jgi:carboxymethylenebutenolidase
MSHATVGRDVTLTTAEGPMPTYEVRPEGGAQVPGVMLCMDAAGLRDSMRRMADRVAGAGYHVLVPELYHRLGPYRPFDPATITTDAPERERLFGMLATVTTETVTVDATACFDHLVALPSVRGGKAMVHGYCMGGRVAFTLAGSLPDRVAVAASFHGAYLVTGAPSSPHLLAERIRARVYVGWADEDGSFTPDNAATLEAVLTAAGVHHQLERYAGARHGFAVPSSPSYDAAAAERHWQRLLALYAEVAATL